jgi:hypothetical protein
MANRPKLFKLRAGEIKPLARGRGGCIATDMITVHGMKVGFMYREGPLNAQASGWCFMAGVETPEYMDDPANHAIYDLNTIANYDPEIISLLDASVGSAFERHGSTGKLTPVKFQPGN